MAFKTSKHSNFGLEFPEILSPNLVPHSKLSDRENSEALWDTRYYAQSLTILFIYSFDSVDHIIYDVLHVYDLIYRCRSARYT